MNINLDDIVKISVKEGAGIEKINIRYIRSNIPSTTSHPDKFDNNRHLSKNKNSISEEMPDTFKSGANLSPIACQITPSRTSSNRPKQSYFFGQSPLPRHEPQEERKDSALYKVRKPKSPCYCIDHSDFVGISYLVFVYHILK